MNGENDDDKIYGNNGDDNLLGEGGEDSIWGGDGADIIRTGKGSANFAYDGVDDVNYVADGDVDTICTRSTVAGQVNDIRLGVDDLRTQVAMRSLQIFALLLGAPLAAQTTRNVPGAYPTIQAAISASVDGDTVLVAPGSYLEHVDYLGKAVEVRSSGGASVTTVRGGGVGPVIIMQGVPAACSLRGFTIDNGRGDGSLSIGIAGGVTVSDCDDATIAECIVHDCVGSDLTNGSTPGPGGVLIRYSNYLVDRCTIAGNRGADAPDVPNSMGGAGGISLVGGSGTLQACDIMDNDGGLGGATSDSAHAGPGGLLLDNPHPAIVVDCVFENNRGGHSGTGDGNNGGAGGLMTKGWELRVDRCWIVGNVGGGDGPDSGMAGPGGILMQSGASGNFPPPELVNCLVANNIGGDGGVPPTPGPGFGGAGGVTLNSTGRYLVENCTIANNVGGVKGAGGVLIRSGSAPSEISNCLVWGNDGWGVIREQIDHASGVEPIITYCDVQGGWQGEGNVDLDPAFVDATNGDFRLSCASPVIDLGSDALPIGTEDLDGNPRVLGQGVDMGAYEFTPEDFPGYCIATSNSSGLQAQIAGSGCHSIAANDLTLSVSGLPGTPGLFFYGPNQIQVTFGDGFRCVGGAIRRTPPMAGMGSIFVKQLDLSTLNITAAATTNFQFWFRDPMAGGTGFNLSNGLRVDFEP